MVNENNLIRLMWLAGDELNRNSTKVCSFYWMENMGKSRPPSILISANQIHEFTSSIYEISNAC